MAYGDGANGGKATVMKYDGTNWVNVGGAGNSPGSASSMSFYVYKGAAYVAISDSAWQVAVWVWEWHDVMLLTNNRAGGMTRYIRTTGGFFGDEVQVGANPGSGYNFTGWTDVSGALVSTNAIYSFTMPDYTNYLVANFQSVPLIRVVNGVPFTVTINDTNGILTGSSNTTYGAITGVAGGNGNNGNVISGTLSELSTTTPTNISLGSVTIRVQAVNPPTTTLDSSKSFY